MRTAASVCLTFLTALTAAAASGSERNASFSPEGCEFVLDFPEPPRVEQGPAHDGRRTTTALLEGHSYVVNASCTTGYPHGALSALDDDQLRAFVDRLALGMRIENASVRIQPGPIGRMAEVAGELPGAPSAGYLERKIVYGTRSRFILEVVAGERDTARQIARQYSERLHTDTSMTPR